jgi:competence protein ComFC
VVDSDRGIIRLIFPPRCVICRGLLDIAAEMEICDTCYGSIPFYEGDPKVYPRDNFDALVSLCRYEGSIRRSILNYKFFGREAYVRAFASLLHEKLTARNIPGDIDLVLAVPLHRAKLKKRGYNQSALLSSALAGIMNKPEVSAVLKRRRDTVSQSTLPGYQRYDNIKDAFFVTKGDKLHGKNLLLVDDILTTGSTMGECSRVLKEAGAARITAAVLATSRGA